MLPALSKPFDRQLLEFHPVVAEERPLIRSGIRELCFIGIGRTRPPDLKGMDHVEATPAQGFCDFRGNVLV